MHPQSVEKDDHDDLGSQFAKLNLVSRFSVSI